MSRGRRKGSGVAIFWVIIATMVLFFFMLGTMGGVRTGRIWTENPPDPAAQAMGNALGDAFDLVLNNSTTGMVDASKGVLRLGGQVP
jgi:hypothetical protein